MQKEYHPNAYLLHRKNVVRGLKARTKILEIMMNLNQNKSSRGRIRTAKIISVASKISYSSSFHHLRLLEEEKIVMREGKKPYKWKLTGLGQKSLMDIDISPKEGEKGMREE